MVVAADLAGGAGDGVVAEHQAGGGELRHVVAAQAGGGRGVVVALHPDEAMRLRHRVQAGDFAGGEARGALGVVERVAERDDDARLIAAQQQGQAIERGVGVPGRQQHALARIGGAFLQVQVGDDERAGGGPDAGRRRGRASGARRRGGWGRRSWRYRGGRAGEGEDGVEEGFQFGAGGGGDGEVLAAEDGWRRRGSSRKLASFARPKCLAPDAGTAVFDGSRFRVPRQEHCGRSPDRLWILGQYGSSHASNSYWAACGWKRGSVPDPCAHLRFRIVCVCEVGRMAAGVNIGQRDHRVVGLQQTARPVASSLSSFGIRPSCGAKSSFGIFPASCCSRKSRSKRLESLFGRSFDDDRDARGHDRPPRRPMLQSWSSV